MAAPPIIIAILPYLLIFSPHKRRDENAVSRITDMLTAGYTKDAFNFLRALKRKKELKKFGTPSIRPRKNDFLSTALPDTNLKPAVIINEHEKSEARKNGFSEGNRNSEKTFIMKSPVPIEIKRSSIIKIELDGMEVFFSALREIEKSRIVKRDNKNPAVWRRPGDSLKKIIDNPTGITRETRELRAARADPAAVTAFENIKKEKTKINETKAPKMNDIKEKE